MNNINTTEDIQNALTLLGYESTQLNESVAVKVGSFTALLTIAEDNLRISCRIATMSQINPDKEGEFYVGMLDANSRIVPYAYALLTSEDGLDENSDDIIVLTDSVPLGDFSQDELACSLTSLRSAILESASVIRVGLSEVKQSCCSETCGCHK